MPEGDLIVCTVKKAIHIVSASRSFGGMFNVAAHRARIALLRNLLAETKRKQILERHAYRNCNKSIGALSPETLYSDGGKRADFY